MRAVLHASDTFSSRAPSFTSEERVSSSAIGYFQMRRLAPSSSRYRAIRGNRDRGFCENTPQREGGTSVVNFTLAAPCFALPDVKTFDYATPRNTYYVINLARADVVSSAINSRAYAVLRVGGSTLPPSLNSRSLCFVSDRPLGPLIRVKRGPLFCLLTRTISLFLWSRRVEPRVDLFSSARNNG